MQKKWLEEYTDYLEQIDDLHEKRRKLPKASDLVKGSSASHPYTKHAGPSAERTAGAGSREGSGCRI